MQLFYQDRTLYTPGAVWEEHAGQEKRCPGNKCGGAKLTMGFRHHCRWCGGLFCDLCAPQNRLYRDKLSRSCAPCRVPIIFRWFYNPFLREYDSTPSALIQSFLSDRDVTSLLQTTKILMTHWPLPGIPFCKEIEERFPTFFEGACVGNGGFASVFQCKDKRHPERGYVAVKVIKKGLAYHSCLKWKSVYKEIDILKRNNHPNVVSFYEVFQTEDLVVIVMEAGRGGKLRKALSCVREHKLPIEPFVANVARQVSEGLRYLLSRNILHRDIKLDNIVLNEDYSRVIIIDFGLAEVLADLDTKQDFGPVGTVGYLAPEALRSIFTDLPLRCTGRELSQCDMFSLGVMVFTMLTGKRVFLGGDTLDHFKQVKDIKQKFTSELWRERSAGAKKFTTQLLEVNPSNRINCFNLSNHEFITHNNPLVADFVSKRKEIIDKEETELGEWTVFTDDDDPECTAVIIQGRFNFLSNIWRVFKIQVMEKNQ